MSLPFLQIEPYGSRPVYIGMLRSIIGIIINSIKVGNKAPGRMPMYRVSQKKVSIKHFYSELLTTSNSQFLNLFGFSISVSFVWCFI